MTPEAWTALEIAVEAHEGQRRADGSPFITHPIAVARTVDLVYGRPDLVAAAFLHDVVEDTPLTGLELRALGISMPTIHLVYILTHLDTDTYAEYIDRVALSWDATVIKRADINHNLRNVDDYYPRLRTRYERALEALPTYPEEAASSHGR